MPLGWNSFTPSTPSGGPADDSSRGGGLCIEKAEPQEAPSLSTKESHETPHHLRRARRRVQRTARSACGRRFGAIERSRDDRDLDQLGHKQEQRDDRPDRREER